MKKKYFISTINFSPGRIRKISDVVPKMIDNGIQNIEISSFHPYEKNLNKKIIKYSKINNTNILLHNFIPLSNENLLINLCSKNKKYREKVKSHIKNNILLTKDLNNDYYSFHAGFRVNYKNWFNNYEHRLTRKQALNIFINEINDLLNFAEENKVHIGVENHICIYENKDNLILYDINDWDTLLNRVSSHYFHLHLDSGHLNISSIDHNFDKIEFIKSFSNKIMAVHIHDNTGMKIDGHAPISNNFWIKKDEFRYLKNLKYTILETSSYGNIKLINDMIGILESRR